MHTAASVDTPYYLREGMNYDRGFQSFFMNTGQDTLWSLIPEPGYHNEALDVRTAWRSEADRNAPKTFMSAMRWLEQHYREDFFLYVDTWDPHEPWDAPAYYTELYWPGYDGELVLPVYGNWHDVPGYEEEQLRKGHATYCGEITPWSTPGPGSCCGWWRTWGWRKRPSSSSPPTTASTSENTADFSAR